MDRDSQGRLYDGHTVIEPDTRTEPAPTRPPVSRRELVYGWICAGIVAVVPIVKGIWP